MAKEHAHESTGELKRHGDPLETVLDDVDRHSGGSKKDVDPVPMPENGGHAHSQAAHLGGAVQEQTKPKGDLRHGVTQGELREPPMVTQRIGKEHRKQ